MRLRRVNLLISRPLNSEILPYGSLQSHGSICFGSSCYNLGALCFSRTRYKKKLYVYIYIYINCTITHLVFDILPKSHACGILMHTERI